MQSFALKFLAPVLLCFPILAGATTAKSYIALDEEGNVLLEHAPDVRRPMASITKLFIAERNAGLPLDEHIIVTAEDVRKGESRSSPLIAGHSYSRRDLLSLAMVRSDNVAALALSRVPEVPLPADTVILEGSGLNPKNVSTARSIAQLAQKMVGSDAALMSVQPMAYVGNHVRKNTNPLTGKPTWDFLLTKTGFINQAGGCVVTVLKIKDRLVTIVILGSSTVRTRWCDLAELRRKLGDSDFQAPSCTIKKPLKKQKKRKRT
jgi:D-alanyl-D-alanine endopeptidase (penicillin-binding protein 7)